MDNNHRQILNYIIFPFRQISSSSFRPHTVYNSPQGNDKCFWTSPPAFVRIQHFFIVSYWLVLYVALSKQWNLLVLFTRLSLHKSVKKKLSGIIITLISQRGSVNAESFSKFLFDSLRGSLIVSKPITWSHLGPVGRKRFSASAPQLNRFRLPSIQKYGLSVIRMESTKNRYTHNQSRLDYIYRKVSNFLEVSLANLANIFEAKKNWHWKVLNSESTFYTYQANHLIILNKID